MNRRFTGPGHLSSALLAVCFLLIGNPTAQGQAGYLIKSRDISIRLSGDGNITGITLGKNGTEKKLAAFSFIEGCVQEGNTEVRKNQNGSVEFSKILISQSASQAERNSCTLTEKFIPTASSIRWELEIKGRGASWASRINTEFDYPATAQTRFWTAWGSPPYDTASVDGPLREMLRPFPGGAQDTSFFGKDNDQWVDPLHAIPFADTLLYYGLPYFTYQQPRIGICPFQGNLFCIPLCSILEIKEDAGLTIALSPEDDIVDMTLHTKQNGTVNFSRLFNRISPDNALKFSLDITSQAADWRGGLGWMANRYPRYFLPQNKQAYRLAGTGAYAGSSKIKDDRKLREMDFKTNWQASFDFPYMGMFLPPVKKGEQWKRFGNGYISAGQMAAYAGSMKKAGFHVLNYFNVTEFGTRVKYPAPAGTSVPEKDWWKDCNIFLYKKIPGALLKTPGKMRVDKGGKTQPGGPIYTWEDGIAMDCGDPAYKDFLLRQAQRHIREIPDADGICIDRIDWLRFFNEYADDGKTWFEGKPVRSLVHSFKQLLDTLGPMMHRSGKNIFVNNHDKRIDILNHTDGVFDEFTYLGSPLNLTALLCVDRPALGWTDAAITVKNEGADNFFQKYLYMGVYPMCPYPANDHSIQPDSLVDGYYAAYGPLLKLLQGRVWVLKPHVISVDNDLAKVNLFETPDGYVVPVVYGKAAVVRVTINESAIKPHSGSAAIYKVWYPGNQKATALRPIRKDAMTSLNIPLHRGCAMLSVSR